MSSIASKKQQSKPAPVDADEPIPFKLTEVAPPTVRPLLHLDMTLREVMGADQSWHEINFTGPLCAVQDLAQDACMADGDPHSEAAHANLDPRSRLVAIVALAHRALEMFDAAEETDTAKGGAR